MGPLLRVLASSIVLVLVTPACIKETTNVEVNSVTEAIPRAEAALRTLVSDHDFRLRTESTQEKNFGWVFFYAPQRYLETGDRKYLVPGTAPLIVLRDGRVEWLPSSLPPAAAIERFEAQWTERQRE